MLKTLRNLIVGAILLLAYPFTFAQALTVVTNTTDQLFNAVGEVSSTLVATPFGELTIFVHGTYAAGNTLVLQRQVGSPGSGAFEDVLTITTGTANARLVGYWTSGPNPKGYRLKMTATGTGAIVAHMTDASRTARSFVNSETQIVRFDDFVGDNSASTTAVNASKWIATRGGDAGGTIAVRTADVHEGTLQMIAGNGDIADGVCVSSVAVAAAAALPTDPGMIVYEIRLQAEQVDGLLYMALQTVLCNGTLVRLADMDSGVFVQTDGTNADMIGILRQDEATDTDDWQAFSSLVDVEGNNALEVPLGVVGVATEYDTLRVEVDDAGNGYWYINGDLVHAEALAVTPGTRIMPAVFAGETAAGGGTIEVHIDYILFVAPRPVS